MKSIEDNVALQLPSIKKVLDKKQHTCYDDMINERLFAKIPKNISYKKQYMEAEKQKSKTIDSQAQKTQKNLVKSAVDQLISTTKMQLKKIN